MKLRLLVTVALTASAVVGWSIWVDACDHDKQTSATTAGAECPYHAHAATLTAGSCAGHAASAVTASNDACRNHASATVASNGACAGHAAAAAWANDACAGHGASATTASNGACRYHDASAAGMGISCLSGMSMHAASSGCAGHGAQGAQGAKWSESRTTDAHAAEMHEHCDACKQMEACAQQLSANGAQLQVVSLKNGVMFVYTTDTPARARAIQRAMAQRSEQIASLASTGEHAQLCPDCKVIRGAMASGKLARQTINIEGGCIALMTSSDAAVVGKLHSMAGGSSPGRSKI